ncbi:hypothetical protein [Streptomyces lydicus]|uniref:hypothetical protein n=1 Tax=Streptomyces lydicus TaxID=47763 RepID=UPI0038200A1E
MDGERPTRLDLLWQAAADELAPHKSLARMAANARSAIGTITIVATLLAGLGTFAASQLTDYPWLTTFAAVSVAAATAAVILSLIALVNREAPISVNDLEQVKEWYEKRLEKGKLAASGGVALIGAVVLAAVTSIVGLLVGAWDADTDAQMSLSVARKDAMSTAHLSVDVNNVPSSALVQVQLLNSGKKGDSERKDPFLSVIRPKADGEASINQDVEVASGVTSLRLEVRVMDGQKTLKSFSLSTGG